VGLESYPSANDTYNVTLTNNILDYGLTFVSYFFIAPPQVTGVNPPTGTSRGNIPITISGTNFLPAAFAAAVETSAMCYFGSNRVAVTSITNTAVTCTLPPGSGTVPVMISLNGVDLYTEYPGGSIISFTYISTSNVENCRGTAELSYGVTFRTSLGLSYYNDILTQPNVAYFYNVSTISTSANPARISPQTDACNIEGPVVGGFIDGDRCCNVSQPSFISFLSLSLSIFFFFFQPTQTNDGTFCGVNFQNSTNCTLVLDFSAAGMPASINEVLVSWYEPCFNLPTSYSVYYWNLGTSSWSLLLQHDTSPNGNTPCLLSSSDTDTVALCLDFFQAVVTTKIMIGFDNTGSEFSYSESRGGWIYEVEPHGVFVNQPVSFSLSIVASSCVGSICTISTNSSVSLPTVVAQLYGIQGNVVPADNIPGGVEIIVSCQAYLSNSASPTTCPFQGSGAFSIINSGGNMTLGGLTLSSPAVGSYVITFNSTSMPSQSITLNIVPGVPASMTISPASIVLVVNSNSSFAPISVSLYDVSGNLVNTSLLAEVSATLINSQNNGIWPAGFLRFSNFFLTFF